MADRNFSTVRKILIYQLLIIIIADVGFAILGEWQKALSFALGGLTAFLPNLCFGLQIHISRSKDAREIVNAFYFGEVGKWILTIALFVVIFKLPNIEIFSLLIGYVMAVSVFWFALLMR